MATKLFVFVVVGVIAMGTFAINWSNIAEKSADTTTASLPEQSSFHRVSRNTSAEWQSHIDSQFGFSFQYPPNSTVEALDKLGSKSHLRTYNISGNNLDFYIEVFKKPRDEDLLTWYEELYSKPIRSVVADITIHGDVTRLEESHVDGQPRAVALEKESIVLIAYLEASNEQESIAHSRIIDSLTFDR